MTHVSHSEVEDYLSCRRKHYYGYGLRLQPKKLNTALEYGRAGHAVLQTFYDTILSAGPSRIKQRRMFKQALSDAEKSFNNLGFEQPEDKADLHSLLFDYYFPNEPFVREGWLIEATEVEHDLEIEDGLEFKFVIDLVVVDPQNKRAVVDHKFKGRFDNADTVTMLPQVSKYIGALRVVSDQPVHYGIYNEFKTSKIRGAKKTKKQLLESFPERDGLDKLLLEELTGRAREEGIDLYAGPTVEQALLVLKIKPNNTQIVNTFSEQIAVSEEIVQRRSLPIEELAAVSYRSPDPQRCGYCKFRVLCESDLTGGNSALILDSDFEVKPRRNAEEELDEDDSE